MSKRAPTRRTPRIAAVLLAAGGSERLGTPKQLLRDATGRPLVARTVDALHAAAYDPVIVIIGAHAEDVTHALIDEARAVMLVPNTTWRDGMGCSIRKGIAFLSTQPSMRDVEAVTIAACDMPTADAAHFRALHDAAVRHGSGGTMVTRVASVYAGRDGGERTRGIPACFPRGDWPALLALDGDRGAKPLLDTPDTMLVELRGGSFDLDTPADVDAWRAST